jgi:hypothetical protein
MPQTHFQAPVYVCYDRLSASRPPVRATLNFLKDCVFNRQAMPWFREAFHLPESSWHTLLLKQLTQLSQPQAFQHRSVDKSRTMSAGSEPN